jgi:hypothetical protein
VVRIVDRKGVTVADVLSSRQPSPAEGESVRYFPPWPRLYVAWVDYDYLRYLKLAGIPAVSGLAVFFGAWRLKRSGTPNQSLQSTAPLGRG